MNKKIRVMAIAFALLVAAGCLNMSLAAATAQDNRVGFEISPHHFGISVPNLEESIAWYRKMLGFEVVQRMTQGADNAMIVALLQRGNFYLELFQVAGAKPLPEYRRDPTADLRVHGLKQMAFQVSDVLAATKELKAKGAEVAMGPVDSPGVVFVFIRDNSGNTFELIQFKKR
jgi:methylmalonyl-CoA/ethylmalonyl-CoA epimerase